MALYYPKQHLALEVVYDRSARLSIGGVSLSSMLRR